MNVEMMGVNYVRLALSKTDYVVPNINDNDREPSWDGDVQVYRRAGDSHRKDDLILKVPVQIKGHKENNLKKQTINYSVELSDLRNYLNIGGTTFLVVYVHEDGEKHQIYYNNLLPFDLRRIINKYGEQKTKQIKLKALSKKKDEIAETFLFAATHMKKQKPAISCEPVSMDDLIASNQLSGASFSFSPVPNKENNPFDYMLNHETYIYAKLPFGLELPVEHVIRFDMAKITPKIPVSVNGVVFYSEVGIIHKKDIKQIIFGESTTISFPRNATTHNIKFTLSGTLSQRINDLDFLIHALEARHFEIDGNFYPLTNINEDNIEKFNIPERKKHLQWLRTIQILFNKLDIKEEMDWNNISDNDDRTLVKLVQSVLNKEYIEFKDLDDRNEYFPEISISNLYIKLCAYKSENANECILFNYSESPLIFASKNAKGEEIKASYHVFLKKESMLKCSNINYTKVIRHIQQYPLIPEYSDSLVCLLLEMLDAFDESNESRDDILDGAINLSEWLKDFDKNTSKDLLDINYYQSLKRRRTLASNEIQVLHSIIEGKPTRSDIYVGAYILLDDYQSAQKHFNELTSEEQEKFCNYPIYHLWNKAQP